MLPGSNEVSTSLLFRLHLPDQTVQPLPLSPLCLSSTAPDRTRRRLPNNINHTQPILTPSACSRYPAWPTPSTLRPTTSARSSSNGPSATRPDPHRARRGSTARPAPDLQVADPADGMDPGAVDRVVRVDPMVKEASRVPREGIWRGRIRSRSLSRIAWWALVSFYFSAGHDG
jgi:hypothetical protein